MNAEGKLEIQEFKIEKNIPQYELNEDVEEIEKSLKKIEKSKEKVKKDDPRYEEKMVCRDYDILCGEKELSLAKLKAKKNMGIRVAKEAIKELEGMITFHKDNLRVFIDQLRNKVRKERIIPKQIQLENGDHTEPDEESK